MQIIDQVPFEAIIQAWLKTEWYSDFYNPVRNYIPQSLIDDEDFSNQQNNELRYWLLRTTRFPLLDTLPPGITWYSATYDRADIARTYIVPSADWGPISQNRYQPDAIIQNLRQNPNTAVDHAAKIRDIKASRSPVDRRLILVASNINSVLTIIEGNHRGIVILEDALDRGSPDPIIAEVFVGISPNMGQYIFHIEQHLVAAGLLRPGP